MSEIVNIGRYYLTAHILISIYAHCRWNAIL